MGSKKFPLTGSGIKEGGIRSTHFHPATKLNKMHKRLIYDKPPLSFNALLLGEANSFFCFIFCAWAFSLCSQFIFSI